MLSKVGVRRNLYREVTRNSIRIYPLRTLFVGANKKTNLPSDEKLTIAENSHPILKRIPKFLRPYALKFMLAPVSHVTAFLILHELSAIVPLIGIWYTLHQYPGLVPAELPSWAIEKGILVIDKSLESMDLHSFSLQEKARIIMEGAYAYAIVKALFPIRIAFSLLLMPLFANRVVVPFTRLFRRRKWGVGKNKSVTDSESLGAKPATPKKITKPRL